MPLSNSIVTKVIVLRGEAFDMQSGHEGSSNMNKVKAHREKIHVAFMLSEDTGHSNRAPC